MLSLWPPTELAEGYQYERVTENYVLSDGTRNMNIYYVQPLQHGEGMLMVYLPQEKIVIEADLFDTHLSLPSTPTDANMTLYNQVQRLNLDVSTIAPIHGRPLAWTDFLNFLGEAAEPN